MAPADLVRYRKLTLIILPAAALLMIFLCYIFYQNEKEAAEENHFDELKSVGELKATQLSSWYNERTSDARYFSTATLLPEEIERFNQTGRINRTRLLKFFGSIADYKVYEEVMITSPDGRLLFSLDQKYMIDPVTKSGIDTVLRRGEIYPYNIYYCPLHGKIHNDIMAPVYKDGRITAILILRTDPSRFLYPYLQKWPGASKTAETILVTRNGNNVIFLNEMRKVQNTALKYTIPLTDTMVPAVMLVKGKTGRFKGRDYAGEKVFSYLIRINNTPWSMVVKIDNPEVYNEAVSKSILVLSLGVMAILLISGVLVYGYRKRRMLSERLRENEEHERFAEQLQNVVNERTQELNRSNADLVRFAHVISHDLKEPVRKIKFFISMVMKDHSPNLGKDVLGYLRKIDNSAQRITNMIDDVLKYSEIQDPGTNMDKVDLNEVIANVINDLELLIQSKKANVVIEKLPQIEGVTIQIHQLFYNLVNNALKFSKEDGQIRVTIGGKRKVFDKKVYTEITISDNGIGFDEAYSKTIFESFKRLHPKDQYEGTGLGLSLCKQIVQRHHGSITATGAPGKGATFTVLLPQKQEISD